jgi:LuxR family transcriptional regulator, maltose regulon positive regulatory protein
VVESRASPQRPRGGREELLATKVAIPRVRAGSLVRSRLLAALDETLVRELTLVSTPAGFGKTTLLAEWARVAKGPVAWLSLDPEDSDPNRFWRYVAAALDRAVQPDEPIGLPLESARATSSDDLVVVIVNTLETHSREVALVLDDYHAIASSEVHESVAFVLDHLPRRLHLVVSTRTDPPLPLARLRARDQLAELRATDLRFTADESAAFLRDVWGLDLAHEAMGVLETRTEGWAVGLQLAALSLREHPEPTTFLDAFSGSHRYVLDYLSDEVLERLPGHVRSFLLRTSILQRLNGPLCDAVTGGSEGQKRLEQLERANLFLRPLDDERRWYRFHHLFRDLLHAELARTEPARMPELHRRAAAWFERHALIDEAMRHAIAAEDSDWAAGLVEQHMGEILRREEGVILSQWLSALPEEVVRTRLNLCLAQGWMQLHIGHLDAAEALTEHAERASEGGDGAVEDLELPILGGMVTGAPAALGLLRADLAAARGDLAGLAHFAGSALARMRPNERGPRFLARFQLACVDWMGGRLAEAEVAFARLREEGRAAPDPYPLETSCFALAQVQAGLGRLGAALRTNRDSLGRATESGRISAFHLAEAHIGIAQILYQRDYLDEALRHANTGIDLCRHSVEFALPAIGLLTLAWIRFARGEEVAALDAADEACRIRPNQPAGFVALWNPAEAERARLLLAVGRLQDAEHWVEEWGLSEDDEVSYAREREHLLLTRLLLGRREPNRALSLLDRLEALARSQGRVQSMIEMRALRSLALQSSGDHKNALSTLGDALSDARPEAYIRVFADEAAPMAALIQRLIRQRQGDRSWTASRHAQEHLLRVAGAFRSRGRSEGDVVSLTEGTVEPLTARELDVLSLLAAGRRNRDIADELVVTLDTVKRHVSHIFDKLGAANRTDAVAKAREFHLIP